MNLSSSHYGSDAGQHCLSFSHPLKRQRVEAPGSSSLRDETIQRYTDADLAADLNALSFEERHKMEEDIHGVADAVEETDAFVNTRMKEMRSALDMIPNNRKEAWDRAVFLRPSLAWDRPLHLMFLRAARFDVRQGAESLLCRYETKRRLFGDDLLIHRITWQDLTPEEQSMVKTGFMQLIPNHDRTGRGTLFLRFCRWDTSNAVVYLRSAFYIIEALHYYPEVQRKGVVSIGDFRGTWKSSLPQILKLIGDEKYVFDRMPYHNATGHLLYDHHQMNAFIQAIRAVVDKNQRMRHRCHGGSNMEIEYSLRSFGIDLSDCLALGSPTGPMSVRGIEEEISRREKIDEEWRQSEIPYRDPSSREALFPNPQDVIVGRSRKITLAWPGNIVYNRLIEQHAPEYGSVDDQDRIAKTSIAIQIFGILRRDYKARFLSRKDRLWEVVDDVEAQRKVSQALRTAARYRKEQHSS